MTAALQGQSILVAHEDGEHAAAIEHAIVPTGATIVVRAASVAEAIERIDGYAPSVLVFSERLAGDTRALIDAAASRKARVVILYPAGSEPEFPFDDYRCLTAPYTAAEVVEALVETVSASRGCRHWSAGPMLWD